MSTSKKKHQVKPVASGCARLRPASSNDEGPKSHKKSVRANESSATSAVRIARERCELMTCDGATFARTVATGKVLPMGGKAFGRYLAAAYLQETEAVLTSSALKDAVRTLQGLAGEIQRPVHVRTCGSLDDGCVHLNLGAGRVARVSSSSIDILDRANAIVNFWEPSAAQSLPDPDLTGSLEDIRSALSLEGDELFIAAGWLVCTLLPNGPYPILAVYGPHGSGKSTRCRHMTRLVDPSDLLLRLQPKNNDDLVVAARATHILTYDNVSKISVNLSDGLCRVATGGGISKRTLYTDTDVTVVKAKRPVIINSIVDVVTRSDLADRLMLLRLDATKTRMTERAVNQRFERYQPKALGAILKGVQSAIRNHSTVQLPVLPRMADAAAWGEAALRGLGAEPMAFYNAFMRAAEDATAQVVEENPVGELLHKVATEGGGFQGTASRLLRRMKEASPEAFGQLPPDATRLSAAIRRLNPALQKAFGWKVEFKKTRDARLVIIPSVANEETVSISATDVKGSPESGCDVGDPFYVGSLSGNGAS